MGAWLLEVSSIQLRNLSVNSTGNFHPSQGNRMTPHVSMSHLEGSFPEHIWNGWLSNIHVQSKHSPQGSWRREWLPTPVFWPGEFQGLCSPWDCRELDLTEWLSPNPPTCRGGPQCPHARAQSAWQFLRAQVPPPREPRPGQRDPQPCWDVHLPGQSWNLWEQRALRSVNSAGGSEMTWKQPLLGKIWGPSDPSTPAGPAGSPSHCSQQQGSEKTHEHLYEQFF